MNEQPVVFTYIASAIGMLVAAGLVVQGEFGPAAVVAAGAAFLIYWARRQDREGGDG